MVDSFFVNPAKSAKKRRAENSTGPTRKSREPARRQAKEDPADENITSDSESDTTPSDIEEESESDHETAADKRRRLAKEYLQNLEDELTGEHEFDAGDLDREIIGRRLKQDVSEDHGKIFRFLGDASVSTPRHARTKARHLTGVAATWPYAYTISKDMNLQKWRLSSGKPQLLNTVRAGSRNAGLEKGHCGEILCIASSPNGQYVVTGGRDHRLIVWSAENLSLVKSFDIRDRNGTVLSVVFRRGSLQLYVGCGDLKLRTYDLAQLAHVEILYGHQDLIVDICALSQERCVSVGSRDRTAIVWKIPEESRLTFRGGDTKLLARAETDKEMVLEGSIDCCTMFDNEFFATGSDNGNISIWSTQRKKPVHIEARGHGTEEPLAPSAASAEADPSVVEIPPPQPRYITSIAAVPYSDVLFTGSWSGTVKMWKLTENKRGLELVKEIPIGKGIVTRLTVTEKDKKEFVVVASLSREPRLGRWKRVSGHDSIVTFSISS